MAMSAPKGEKKLWTFANSFNTAGGTVREEQSLSVQGYGSFNNNYKLTYKDGRLGVQKPSFFSSIENAEVTYLDSQKESKSSTQYWIVSSLIVSSKGIAPKYAAETLNKTDKNKFIEIYEQIGSLDHDRQKEVLLGLNFSKRKELLTTLDAKACAEIFSNLLRTESSGVTGRLSSNPKTQELYRYLVQNFSEKASDVFNVLSGIGYEVTLLGKLSDLEVNFILHRVDPNTIVKTLLGMRDDRIDFFHKSILACTTGLPEVPASVGTDSMAEWYVIADDIDLENGADCKYGIALKNMKDVSVAENEGGRKPSPKVAQDAVPQELEISIPRAQSIIEECSPEFATILLLDLLNSYRDLACELLMHSNLKNMIFNDMISLAAEKGEPALSSVSYLFCVFATRDVEQAKVVLRQVTNDKHYPMLFAQVSSHLAAAVLFDEKPATVAIVLNAVYPDNIELVKAYSGLGADTGFSIEASNQQVCWNKMKSIFVLLHPPLQLKLLSSLKTSEILFVTEDVQHNTFFNLLLQMVPEIAAEIIGQIPSEKTNSLAHFIDSNASKSELSSILQHVEITKLHTALAVVPKKQLNICMSEMPTEQQMAVLRCDLETSECLIVKAIPSLVRNKLNEFTPSEQAKLVNTYSGAKELSQYATLNMGAVMAGKDFEHQAIFLMTLNPDCFHRAVTESGLAPEVITCINDFVKDAKFKNAEVAKRLSMLPVDKGIEFFAEGVTKAQVKLYLSLMALKPAAEIMLRLLKKDKKYWSKAFSEYDADILYPRLKLDVIEAGAIKLILAQTDLEFQVDTLIFIGNNRPLIATSVWSYLHTATEDFDECLLKKTIEDISSLIYLGIDEKVESVASIFLKLPAEDLHTLLFSLNQQNKSAKLMLAISKMAGGKENVLSLPPEVIASMFLALESQEDKNSLLSLLRRETPEYLYRCWRSIPVDDLASYIKMCGEQNLKFIYQNMQPETLIDTTKALLTTNQDMYQPIIPLVSNEVIYFSFNALSQQQQLNALPLIVAQKLSQSDYVLQRINDESLLALLSELDNEPLELVVKHMVEHCPDKLKSLSKNQDSHRLMQKLSEQTFVDALALMDALTAKAVLSRVSSDDLITITRNCAYHGSAVVLLNATDAAKKAILESLAVNEESEILSNLLQTVTQNELATLFKLYLNFERLDITKLICQCAPKGLIVSALKQADQIPFLELGGLAPIDVLQMNMAYETAVEESRVNETIYDLTYLIAKFEELVFQQIEISQQFIDCIPAAIKWQLLADHCDQQWCKEYLITASEESMQSICTVLLAEGKQYKAGQVKEQWEFTHNQQIQPENVMIQEPVIITMFDQISHHLLESEIGDATTLFIAENFDSQVILLSQLSADGCGSILVQMEPEQRQKLLIDLVKVASGTHDESIKINQILNALGDEELILAVWKKNVELVNYIDPFTNVDAGNIITKLFAFNEDSSDGGEFDNEREDSELQDAIFATSRVQAAAAYPVVIPEGFELHKVNADGACFFRAKYAIEQRKNVWLTEKTNQDIYRQLVATKDIDTVKLAIKEAIQYSLDNFGMNCSFLIRAAKEAGFEESVKGAANLISRECVTALGFNLYEHSGLLKATAGILLTAEEEDAKNTLFASLPDVVGQLMIDKFDVKREQVDDTTAYVCKPKDNHFDLIAPDGYFER